MIWNTCLDDAKGLSSLPPCCLDPTIMMQHVPPLPKEVCGKAVTGKAVWYVPSPELTSPCDPVEDWDPACVSGVRKTFYLSIRKPTECKISSQHSFGLPSQSNGLAILTLCWSYIFSVRLLEIQKRRMEFSSAIIAPIVTSSHQHTGTTVPLGNSSSKLTRWLGAILAPGTEWFANGEMPPWTAHLHKDTRIFISTDVFFQDINQQKPPSSLKAASLLLELCTLYDFSSQPTLAFLAALLLPWHNAQRLQPQLPLPRIQNMKPPLTAPLYIRDYVHDLRYYMTLSCCPRSIGSAIWSVFWEPGINCNVVSAWFGSIQTILHPLIRSANIEMIPKVFAFRRPKLAPLWVGIFVCGSEQTLSMIERYLTTLEELQSYCSLGYTDSDVAAWTGSHQSFLDEECSGLFTRQQDLVPVADLLRHRFNFRLGDPDVLFFGWNPFGVVKKEQIGPELWPRLEYKSPSRRYLHWIWFDKRQHLVEEGYSNDRRTTKRVDKSSGTGSRGIKIKSSIGSCDMMDAIGLLNLEPSKLATVRVLNWGSTMASGDYTIDSMGLPEVRRHPWLADARGMD